MVVINYNTLAAFSVSGFTYYFSEQYSFFFLDISVYFDSTHETKDCESTLF